MATHTFCRSTPPARKEGEGRGPRLKLDRPVRASAQGPRRPPRLHTGAPEGWLPLVPGMLLTAVAGWRCRCKPTTPKRRHRRGPSTLPIECPLPRSPSDGLAANAAGSARSSIPGKTVGVSRTPPAVPHSRLTPEPGVQSRPAPRQAAPTQALDTPHPSH